MKLIFAKVVVTVAALGLLMIKIVDPDAEIDAAAVGLLAFAVLPWIVDIVESAQLPGGWSVKLRTLEDRQQGLTREVRTLQFVVVHLLTEPERAHLVRLAAPTPFPFEQNDTTQIFLDELQHLRRLGFISNPEGRGIRTLTDGSDVKDHFTLTDRGKEYLSLLASSRAEEQQGQT